MKTQENNYFGFENASHYHNNFAMIRNEMKTHQLVNQGFVVPWQLNEQIKKENLTEKVFD